MTATQAHLRRELEAVGYAVHSEPVLHDAVNLVAELPGRSPKTLVIGAHYDTVPETPGADDNASAVAALLGMARNLAGTTCRRTLRFVLFCNEELPYYKTEFMGSMVHARGCVQRRESVVGMLCLEMVGYFTDVPGSQRYPDETPTLMRKFLPSRGDFLAIVGAFNTLPLLHRLKRGFRRGTDLPLHALPLPATLAASCAMSDHWSFTQVGIPAVMATDTAFYRNPHYHRPTDRPDTLDYDRLAKVVAGLTRALR